MLNACMRRPGWAVHRERRGEGRLSGFLHVLKGFPACPECRNSFYTSMSLRVKIFFSSVAKFRAMAKRSTSYLQAFSTRFRAAMAAKGLSQADLTRLLARTPAEARRVSSAVSRWWNAEQVPDQEMIPRLAAVLGLTIEFLLTGKEPATSAAERQQHVVRELEAEVQRLRNEIARLHGIAGQLLPAPSVLKPSKRRT